MPLPKVYNWERVRAALKQLATAFPEEFPNWVLIGGGACWFYREALRVAADPDFPVPSFTTAEEAIWLSKDVVFMGMSTEEAAELFQAPFKEDTHTITFAGLEVDFLEEGLRLTLSQTLRNMRQVRTDDFEFFVVAPEILYAEKCALIANKERLQDGLHQALLAQFLKHELCADLAVATTLDPRDWVLRARTLKTADLEFFDRDALFCRRLRNLIVPLQAPMHKFLRHWAKHHLPGYPE